MMIPDLRPHQNRAVEAMVKHNKGIICAVTGAGKTLVGIADTMREFESQTPKTVVIVSPRILLAEQLSHEYLEFILNAKVDRKSTRLNSSHVSESRMPSSA